MKHVLAAATLVLVVSATAEAQTPRRRGDPASTTPAQAYYRARVDHGIANPFRSTTRPYYRGPGGEVVTADQIPPGAYYAGGYRFLGNYGGYHRRR